MLRRLAKLVVRVPALLAVVSILLITTVAAAPGLFHGDDFDHCCEFCHLAHVPLLKPASAFTFYAPAALISWVTVAQGLSIEHLSLGSPSSRAPPA